MRLLRDIKKSVAQAGIRTAPGADRAVLEHLLEQLPDNQKRSSAAYDPPKGRRSIMRSPVTRFAAAAVFLGVAGVLIAMMVRTTTPAYAFGQTVEAMQGKRSFHIQTYWQQQRKDEFWAEFDKDGNLIRFRQHESEGPENTLVTIWEDNVMSQYYPPPWGVHLMTHVENTGGGLEGLEEFDPETIVTGIDALVAEGKAVMEMEESLRDTYRMTIHVKRTDGEPLKQTLVVDPVTKFVVRIDDHWGQEDGGTIHHGIEVLEYNEVMDPGLFERAFPEGTVLIDQVTQEVGMAQGDMTNDKAAVEVLRQMLEAWAQGDYATAGNLCGGAPVEMLSERYAHLRPVRILSIGQPAPIRFISPRFRIPCQYEIERDGQTEVTSQEFYVFAVNGRPGRWYVFIAHTTPIPSRDKQVKAMQDDDDTSGGYSVALAGAVVDPQGNVVPDAWIFASYAAPGQTDAQGTFALPAPPTDGSQSIGPVDLPMFVWAYTDSDPYSVAWTVIRPPSEPAPVRRRISDEPDDSDERVEETHQGVVLTIRSEEEFLANLPGDPGQLAGNGSMYGDPQIGDVVLVTGPAGVIAGQVTDVNGVPVADALVLAKAIELQIGSNTLRAGGLDREWKAGFASQTDADGRYSLGHLPSCWTQATIVVEADGQGRAQQVVLHAGVDTTYDIILAEASEEEP